MLRTRLGAGSPTTPLDRDAGVEAPARPAARPRPTVAGKFLTVGSEKLVVRGVSYGTFRPGPDGVDYPAPEVVGRDFASMVANGVNTVRTYTVPPRWLLDLAHRHGLYVMVGLAWEHHVAFLDGGGTADAVAARVRANVRAVAGHPAVLCWAVGNEIPAPIVRWHGRRRVERFLRRLCDVVRFEDPGALVTYVSYPTTEYLDLGFLDLVCFNVYLEDPAALRAYVARLHSLAGDRPVVLAEIGFDSRRHGQQAQADALSWQVRTAYGAGCAGTVVFSWTDEWHVTHLDGDGRGAGGSDVLDWDFGVTDRARRPKPALAAVRTAFAEVPPLPDPAPRVSVVVCSLNGAATLPDCLDGCTSLDYPDYEVIVVDDGSTDDTAAIARSHGATVVSTPNRGLSSARNTGLAHATGAIVAYTDDDARPDPQWLRYLVTAFAEADHVAVGGPNIPPAGDGLVAHCVANAPGGPVHVLLSDSEAEHIPGCNMAFRREALEAIGGFDPRFRTAGDDVDVCWRLQDAGGTIGFHAGAMVWHHRRSRLRTFWRQQQGYGRAEALLEQKWPARYNAAGHVSWAGRLYGGGLVRAVTRRPRIYHGAGGSAPFQPRHPAPTGVLAALPQMPESYLVGGAFGVVGLLGLSWRPALAFGVAAAVLVAVWLVQAARSAVPAVRTRGPWRPATAWALTTVLHLVQPVARLVGRHRAGLTPWRRRGSAPPSVRLWARRARFTRQHRSAEARLRDLQATLRRAGAVAWPGGPYDRWDLAVRGGLWGDTRVLLALEEHGAGMQVVRHRWWPDVSPVATAVVLALASLAALAGAADAVVAAATLAGLGAVTGGWVLWELGRSAGEVRAAIEALETSEDVEPGEAVETGSVP